ncbi:MAG: N-acetylmuramoyl-L-alanine amidase [Waddliaceae bacterium]|jgi:N-acetylmuramoyl-L-alanine amidase|nr:N-acetylmuramoyl-L-alanine amidase [Waddliaceae bacterium]MBT3579575.1 N-acetylmuramoyl-L-alanine amidase [Waddliaceae bacterium]MBT4444437.1 N-acetylmuramoyl-L-alanine amidase [Waddliaceae bacterium]MBT6928182.1 N-acetylmuramoyl-L-alanine amidase [Waddliaceae bacterium]MBT7264327.1 N-acetylmuramoyl-L-alanine amidase [Waddliaceae bacterium]
MIRAVILFAISLIAITSCSSRQTSSTLDTENLITSATTTPIIKKASTIIAIDAGHGGKDPGALSYDKRHLEKHMTLATVMMVKNYLEDMGYDVILTRNANTTLPLYKRAAIANKINADLFVSIHYNSSLNRKANGIEIFYYKTSTTSKQYAQHVLDALIQHTKAPSRGIKPAYFTVLEETTMPAILVEGGFMSNPAEMHILKKPQYLNVIAYSIAEGIHWSLSIEH